jgi:RNA polymerase sigma factor (sigma-70 family)
VAGQRRAAAASIEQPARPVALLRRVVAGETTAWHRFVEGYLGFLYSLAWRYARGEAELADDLVLAALEGLRRPDAAGRPFYRLRRYLGSIAEFGRRGRFTSWLALVVKNLFRDWFREREGRRWLPKTIASLDPAAQQLFRDLLWEGLSEAEAVARLRSGQPQLDGPAAERLLDQVRTALDEHQLRRLYAELLRRRPALPIDEVPAPGDARWEPLDPHPGSRPDGALELARRLRRADAVATALAESIAALPDAGRRVVELLALQGLSGETVCRVLGFRRRQRVYDEMAKARRRLRRALEARGVAAAEVRELTGLLPALEARKDRAAGARSGNGLRPDSDESDEGDDCGGFAAAEEV